MKTKGKDEQRKDGTYVRSFNGSGSGGGSAPLLFFLYPHRIITLTIQSERNQA